MTITVIGGLKKWWQPVAEELRFDLAHENGKNPDRILHRLKRSTAMFVKLESTSHKATYKCFEYAKQRGIPFYILSGSKSQLRDMILKL